MWLRACRLAETADVPVGGVIRPESKPLTTKDRQRRAAVTAEAHAATQKRADAHNLAKLRPPTVLRIELPRGFTGQNRETRRQLKFRRGPAYERLRQMFDADPED